jgi:hypothetical protein
MEKNTLLFREVYFQSVLWGNFKSGPVPVHNLYNILNRTVYNINVHTNIRTRKEHSICSRVRNLKNHLRRGRQKFKLYKGVTPLEKDE